MRRISEFLRVFLIGFLVNSIIHEAHVYDVTILVIAVLVYILGLIKEIKD